MLTWLIDHATLIYWLLICAGLGLLAAWWLTRQRKHLIGLGVLAGLAGLVFLLSILVDTDRKRIWRALQEMIQGIEKRDLKITFAHIAEDCQTEFNQKGSLVRLNKKDLQALALGAIQRGGVQTIRLWEPEFEALEPPRATVFFKAKPFGRWALGAEFCVCRAEFRQDGSGKWLMTKLRLYHPLRSKELLDLPD